MDKLSQIMDTDIDELITDLIGNVSSDNQNLPTEIYQLPVRQTKDGLEINEENKPWIVGTFIPGQYINDRHPNGHNGVDLKAPDGSPIYPIASGEVVAVGESPKGGNYVKTSHEDGIVIVYYAHLKTINVNIGDKVTKNSIIGTMGDSGNAKGNSHLHYEISINGKKVDPQQITGKTVGSLSKKALFVDNLIKKLDTIYGAK